MASDSVKTLWATDLHLGMASPGTRRKFMQALASEEPEAVLVGGDVGEATSFARSLEQIAQAASCPTYFVLGNHDYYRGSIAEVKDQARRLHEGDLPLQWLPLSGVVTLAPGVALVGHGCWGDCRSGNAKSFVRLNDEVFIKELRERDRPDLVSFLRERGDEAAEYIRQTLLRALERHGKVIVLTHVAPTRSTALHEGQPPDDAFAPRFVCQAAGDAILEVMAAHADEEALVLCGHSHGGGVVDIAPNVRVIAGIAEYGTPKINGRFCF